MPRVITATYRLQLTRDFPLAAARDVAPYLHDLGVSHLYLSPILAARAGSAHGYDVIDHARLNPELGTEDDLRALAADLHARGMGIVLDIVPNHMAADYENTAWRDVLERGRSSPFAAWFDIDWDAPRAGGRVVLPVLGDELARVIERGELRVDTSEAVARLAYYDRRFPLDPATLPPELQLAQLDPAAAGAAGAWAAGDDGRARLASLLERQHYALVFWRRTPADLNYRRFFDVNDLVALRMDTDETFEAAHALVLRWVAEGLLDGLRVDHVDGLMQPSWYLSKLRREVDTRRHPDAPDHVAIYVEKILAGAEELPADWPVDGTTGYDFLNDVEEIFLDPAGYADVEANYRGLRRNPALRFADVARDAMRRVLTGALRPDVLRVARIAQAWRPAVSLDAVSRAVIEVIARLGVYRTYVTEPGLVSDADRRVLARALADAGAADGVDAAALALLEEAFFAPPWAGDTRRAELVSRFQQTSGPAAAKGVEDTALYTYVPLVSRNEVGGSPDRALDDSARRLHARNAARAAQWPRTLLATNTHDTKRSADVRARLDVLTGLPGEWSRYVARWRRLNRGNKQTVGGRITPDTNAEYLFYQTLLGIWPPPKPRRRADDLPHDAWRAAARERLVSYMLKAAREAKTWTSWTESDREYEQALDAFVRTCLASDEHFLPDVARLTARVADDGCAFGLARVLLQCAAPGVPDIYQGDELWLRTLVDPDNRRPVDYPLRRRLLEELDDSAESRTRVFAAQEHVLEDRTKLALLATLLRFRREHADLFLAGDYLPLPAGGRDGAVVAFARRRGARACLAVARTRLAPEDSGREPDERLQLGAEFAGEWRSVLTDRTVGLAAGEGGCSPRVADLLPGFQPCELLVRVLA